MQCSNGGTCEVEWSEYNNYPMTRCVCPEGYTGWNCLTQIVSHESVEITSDAPYTLQHPEVEGRNHDNNENIEWNFHTNEEGKVRRWPSGGGSSSRPQIYIKNSLNQEYPPLKLISANVTIICAVAGIGLF